MNNSMPIVPLQLNREYVRANPNWLFLVGGSRNHVTHHGEIAEFAQEPNIYSIPVKIKPCMDSVAFWNDGALLEVFEWELQCCTVEIEQRRNLYEFVVPDPRLGKSNWAGPLNQVAPKCALMLEAWLKKTCSPHVIDWSMPK